MIFRPMKRENAVDLAVGFRCIRDCVGQLSNELVGSMFLAPQSTNEVQSDTRSVPKCDLI